jgi:hypothetical protein
VEDILLYCGEGKGEHYGVIEFAVSAYVTQKFRAAVLQVAWRPLYRTIDGDRYKTDQEWAEGNHSHPPWVIPEAALYSGCPGSISPSWSVWIPARARLPAEKNI